VVGVLSCLLAKTERIRKIFSSRSLAKQAISNADLFKYVIALLNVELLFLIVYSAIPLATPELVIGSGSTEGQRVSVCSEAANYNVWVGLQLSYVGLFLVYGTFVAWQTRNVPTAYNEAVHIMACLMTLLFFYVVILPLQYLVEDSPNALVLLRGVGQSFCAFMILLALFVPKVHFIVTGHANDPVVTESNMSGNKLSAPFAQSPSYAPQSPSQIRGGTGTGTELIRLPSESATGRPSSRLGKSTSDLARNNSSKSITDRPPSFVATTPGIDRPPSFVATTPGTGADL